MKFIEQTAFFMIWLIVFIPLVTAQQLTIQKYSGRDNVNGFVRRDDTLTVEATTLRTITPPMIRIFLDDGTYSLFDTCTTRPDGTFTSCTYSKQLTGFYGVEGYTVKLYDTPGSSVPLEEKTVHVTTDIMPPSIETFTLTPEMSKDGKMQLHYVAQDRAFNPTDTQSCSGLKEITFTYGQRTLLTEPGEKLCRKENTITFDYVSQANYDSGNVCVKATDQLGQQSSPVCQPFKLDKSPPNIQSMQLYELDTSLLTHARTGEEKVGNIVVTILGNEDDIEFNSVVADLSKLNPSLGQERATTHDDDYYTWENVRITTPSTCEITVTAADDLGNTQTKTLTCSIGVDDAGPRLKSITTGFVQDNKQLLGKNGTIIVEFEETGVGMNKSNAYLDLSQLGRGNKVKADRCERNWKCYWNVQPTTSGTHPVRVHTDTVDDLGNAIIPQPAMGEDVVVDLDPPVILSTERIKILHNTVELRNVTVAGDNIEYYIRVKGQDTAFANFSDVSAAEHVEADECNPPDNETQTCKFSTRIEHSGPYLANLTFIFSDLAGNTAPKRHHLQVYGISGETPNYWSIGDVKCSPKLIDRETASLYPHPVFCAINLVQRNRNAETVTTLLKDPTLCVGNETGYVSNVELRNAGFKSKRPTISLTLEPTNFNVNELNISCPIEIYSNVGNLFSTTPEEEIANFSLQFYNLPFGELHKNVQDKIDDAVDSAEDNLKWVSTLEKFVNYISKTCSIKSAITSVLGALDTILLTFTVVAEALDKIPPTKGIAKDVEKMRQQTCTEVKGPLEKLFIDTGETFEQTKGPLDSLFYILDKTCAFVECRLTPETKEFGDDLLVNSGALLSGGGVPGTNWCENFQKVVEFGGKETSWNNGEYKKNAPNIFGDQSSKDVDAKLKGLSPQYRGEQIINVKDSLIWSTACFCVPGIIHNLNKYRQIQCRYASCMLEDVKEKGIPTSYCSDVKSYQTCNFVIGEVFSLLPIVSFLDKTFNVLKEMISNPFAAVSAVTGCLCGGCEGVIPGVTDYCKGPREGWQYWLCSSTKMIAKVGDAAASIKGIEKMGDSKYWETGNEWCQHMEDLVDKRKKAVTT